MATQNPSFNAVPTASAPLRYHPVAVLLHWLLGLAMVAIFLVGLYMADLPFSPQRLKLYNWHKWAGASMLLLSVARLGWRLLHRPPALPAAIVQRMPAWQAAAHHLTHGALYLLFFVVPLLGMAYSSAAGFPIVLFGVLPLPDLVAPDQELAEWLQPLHAAAAWALAVLVLLHVAAALKHQWVDRDGLLLRMMPGRS